jgi:hypothetical protein
MLAVKKNPDGTVTLDLAKLLQSPGPVYIYMQIGEASEFRWRVIEVPLHSQVVVSPVSPEGDAKTRKRRTKREPVIEEGR